MTSPLLGSLARQIHAGLRSVLYDLTLTTHVDTKATSTTPVSRVSTASTVRGFDEQRRKEFKEGDRTVVAQWYALILRPSVPDGVAVLPDLATLLCRDGRSRSVVAVKSDPAAATYELWLA